MFDKNIYIARRKKLVESISDGIILLPGNGEASCNYPDNTYLFRQDSSFLYYFGLDKPGLAAILDAESGEEILFGDDVDIDDIIWMGPQPLIREEAAQVGVTKSASFAALEKTVREALSKGRKVHYLPPYRNANRILLSNLLGVTIEKVESGASTELIKAIVAMRIVKEPCEIAEIDKACNLGYAMHYVAMKMMRLGMVEQELVGAMEGVCYSGGYMPSFPTILSQHGETLHNHSHSGVLEDGKLCVIDAGVEIQSHYCSDNTRTLPCSGRFTLKQKEIYNIVLAANDYARENAKPGVTYRDVHIGSARVILKGLSDLGLVHGDLEEMTAAGVAGLFMPHGLGHNMGLDVHDMENLGENLVGYDPDQKRSAQLGLGSLRMARRLVPGHVITDEPGIYFIPALIEKWKNEGTNAGFVNFSKLEEYYDFGGIRLEDDLLITGDGARILGSKRLPIYVGEIEETMKN